MDNDFKADNFKADNFRVDNFRVDKIFKSVIAGATKDQNKVRGYCIDNKYNHLATTAKNMERWSGKLYKGFVCIDTIKINWTGKVVNNDEFKYMGYAWVNKGNIIINSNYFIKFIRDPQITDTKYMWKPVTIQMPRLDDLIFEYDNYTAIIRLKHESSWNTIVGEPINASAIEIYDNDSLVYKFAVK